MAWNEPGKRDPWQGKKPPQDVEEMLRRLRDGVGRLFGGGGGGGGSSGSGGGSGLLMIGIFILIVVWIGTTSLINIDARQIGVVLRFGRFERVMNSGFNLKWPAPIESVYKVEATTVRTFSDEVRMLTKDENIVVVDFNVQYHINDARRYLFAASQPEETLKQAAESAVRQQVARSDMDTVLSGLGTEVVADTEKMLQQTLDGYNVGLVIDSVNFQKILPPPDVKEAFDDANNAGNNQKQYVNDAQAEAARVIPLARGDAARIRAEAEAYRATKIAAATGEAERFSLVQQQYHLAPEVTRKRLYLETMQEVAGASVKVVDGSNGKSMLYLPIDKIREDAAAAGAAAAANDANGNRGGNP